MTLGRTPGVPGERLRAWVFFPSELATLGLGLWMASRFLWRGYIPTVLYPEVGVIWLFATAAAFRARCTGPFLGPGLGVAARGIALVAIAAAIRYQSQRVTGAETAAIGVMMGVALLLVRAVVLVPGGAPGRLDGVGSALVQAVGVSALSPYARSAQVGAGDYYQYGLMLADFLRQVRAGVFPVLIGQSEFAVGGTFHSLRTAPLFEHVGGALDALTFGVLSVNALQNLVLIGCAWLGALGAYGALRRYAPQASWVAAVLASLYLLCPGVLAPLFSGDMVATFMVVPIMPWFVLGLALSVDHPSSRAAWLQLAVALAALWWAHPPVAIWATGLACAWGMANLATAGARRPVIRCMAEAALLCAVLSVFVFVSVSSLELPRVAGQPSAVLQSVHESWPGSLLPLRAAPGSLLSDLQLGYALAVVALGALGAMGRRSVRFLVAAMAAFLVLLFPFPVVNGWLWAHVPPAVISVTNRWPMQRFYLILAALAIFSGAAGLARLEGRSWRRTLALLSLLAVGFLWSAHEAEKLMRIARASTLSRARSELSMRPGNLLTTPALYVLGQPGPDYFSNSPMNPALENRLFDRATWTLLADGSTPAPGQAAPAPLVIDLAQVGGSGAPRAEFAVRRRETELLTFDFLGRVPRGDLKLTGPTVDQVFPLPASGSELAFGAGPGNRRVIAITNSSDADETVRLTFVSAAGSPLGGKTTRVARIEASPLSAVERAVRLRTLVPLRVALNAPAPAILETPRLFVPGYQATVNGVPTLVQQTDMHLVAVEVPAGPSEVQLTYVGTPVLRLTFWLSLLGWVAVATVSGVRPRWLVVERARVPRLAAPPVARRTTGAVLVATSILALLVGVWWWVPPSGPIRMQVMMPWGKRGGSEPLLSVGHVGAAEIFYVQVLGPDTIRIGRDRWGHRSVESVPFKADFLQPQWVEFSLRPAADHAGTGPAVTVRWNGQLVLQDDQPAYPFGRSEVFPGTNPMGATSCGPKFLGRILDFSR